MTERKGMANPSSGHDELRRWATQTISRLDDFIDIRWRHLKRRFGWDGVPKIQPYIGYANGEQVWLHGRVLTNPPADMAPCRNHPSFLVTTEAKSHGA